MKWCEVWIRSRRSTLFFAVVQFGFWVTKIFLWDTVGITMEVDTIRAGWSGAQTSHVEAGKVEFEHGPPLWPACNAADTFVLVKSPSWAGFSVVAEADFCQFFCNSLAAVRQWWFSPPFLVSVTLWDQPGNVPSCLLSCGHEKCQHWKLLLGSTLPWKRFCSP